MKKRGKRVFTARTTQSFDDDRRSVSEIVSMGNDIPQKINKKNQHFGDRKAESVGTMAGGIAHNFKRLLMGIEGHVSLALIYIDEGNPLYRHLKSIEEGVAIGKELTRQLRGFSRMERYEPHRTAVSRNGTILLVDDEEMVVDVTKRMLEHLGYSVMVALSGPEALEIYHAKRKEIDAVILDMIMPGMSGGEIFDLLKKVNPDIKVMLASGYSPDGEASKILGRGCSSFIQKPFSMNDMARKVREVLNGA
ncbi:MAG: response regulator [Deltaproteobacteria bacterium]|nr:response regulator [Deltaproteobacteria bacterium]